MSIDVGSFLPQTVIFHKVPKARLSEKIIDELELAEAPIELTPRLIRYFRDRIVESLSKRFDVVYDPPQVSAAEGQPVAQADTSPIPQLVVDFFSGGGVNFVPASGAMAKHLYMKQKGGSNEGILVLVEGAITSGKSMGKCLVVLKLEPSEALTLEPVQNHQGLSTYDVQVHDVAFEKKARIFKAALFPRAVSLAAITGYVSDPQVGRAGLHDNDVADFFLGFLGCQFRETADRLTKYFVEYVDRFAKNIEDDARRAKFVIQGLAEVDSQVETIDPQDFAKRSLPPELQDQFLANLRNEDGSVPLIPKDRTLIGSRTENVLAEFAGGMKVWGPREVIATHLKQVDGHWVIDAQFRGMHPTAQR
jgi:37-kD nucleoid-associated bacterial protein